MIPVWIALVFFLLGSMFMVNNLPQKENLMVETRNDVLASDFILYRKTVLKYLDQNPGVSGTTISDTTLSACTACLPLGYTITSGRWSNYVGADKVPLIFSVDASSNKILPVLYEKFDRSMIVGTKNSAGKLISVNGIDTGITIPTLVPPIADKAIVMLGR